jgi:HEAT repeat protein
VAASGALWIALLVLGAAVLVLGLAVVAGRLVRSGRRRRRDRLVATIKPDLIRLADCADESAMRRLVALDARHWTAVAPVAAGLLGTLGGESHTALVGLFERRGIAERALRDLRSRSAVKRAQAAETLGDLGRRSAIDPLCRLLEDRDEAVRLVAARSLGRIGDAAAARPLLNLLGSGRGAPEHIVAQALLRLGPEAVPALVEGAVARDPRVRGIAVEALGRLGGYDAIGIIIAALDGDESLAVRIHAAQALGRLALPSASRPLIEATRSDEPALRLAAVCALRSLGDPSAEPRLRELLSDAVPQVASEAARSLLGLGRLGRAALEQVAAAEPLPPGPSAVPFEPSGAAVARQALAVDAVRPRLRRASGRRG